MGCSYITLSRLLSSITMIKRIRKFIPRRFYSQLYYSLFQSHLVFGISAWGGACSSKLVKVFALQKRCIRLLFAHIQKVLYFLPDACKFAFLSVARSFRSQILNTGQIHEQGRRQDFSLGGGLSASKASRRVQSICAASEASKLWQVSVGAAPSGVQGRSPLAGARGGAAPRKIFAK